MTNESPEPLSTEGSGTPPGMSRTLRNVGLVGASALLIFGVLWLRTIGDSGEAGTAADSDLPSKSIQEFEPGKRPSVPDFTGKLLNGEDFDSATLRGRVVVYNLWGSWCAPCRKEAPALANVATANLDDATFVGITVRDNPAAARAFEKSFGIPYDSISPDASSNALLAVGKLLNTAAIPSTLILDRNGKVAARIIGPVTEITLRTLVEGIAAEAS